MYSRNHDRVLSGPKNEVAIYVYKDITFTSIRSHFMFSITILLIHSLRLINGFAEMQVSLDNGGIYLNP